MIFKIGDLKKLNASNQLTRVWFHRFNTSLFRNGVSDPFKPKSSKANQETKKLYEQISKNTESSKYRLVKENDSLLTQLVKNSLNPKPLNISFREKFNLNNDYNLVYIIDRERLHLIVFGLMNCLFPLFVLFICSFAYTELTDSTQIPESFENPHFFAATLSCYFILIYLISKMVQSRTIFRIYYNEKLNRFVLIRISGIISFKSEEFTSKNVVYRVINSTQEAGKDSFIQNLNKSAGNVYINNKLRRIDFAQFSSPSLIDKLFDIKTSNIIKTDIKNKIS